MDEVIENMTDLWIGSLVATGLLGLLSNWFHFLVSLMIFCLAMMIRFAYRASKLDCY